MKLNKSTVIIVAFALFVGISLGGLFSSSNKPKMSEVHHNHQQESGVWTCSMHPSSTTE